MPTRPQTSPLKSRKRPGSDPFRNFGPSETNEEESLASLKIDVTKYEMYRDLIGALLSYNDIVDDKMGMMALNQLPIPFKLSFNTLLMKGIIKEL